MPNLDRTGPQGLGSRTGRGLGNCSSKQTPKSGFRRSRGRGQGLGRGFGFRANQEDRKKQIQDEENKKK